MLPHGLVHSRSAASNRNRTEFERGAAVTSKCGAGQCGAGGKVLIAHRVHGDRLRYAAAPPLDTTVTVLIRALVRAGKAGFVAAARDLLAATAAYVAVVYAAALCTYMLCLDL